MKHIILTAIYFLLAGCGQNAANEIIYIQDKAVYGKKVASFKVTYAQAVDIAAKFSVKRIKEIYGVIEFIRPPVEPKPFIGKHYVLYGDHYVFSLPDKMYVILTGYYVHGMTGKVEYREVEKRIPYYGHRK